jgi:hypothetical protein
MVVVVAALCGWLASRFMWWASRHSGLWSMAAGVLLALLTVGGAVVIAWLMTRAWYGQ